MTLPAPVGGLNERDALAQMEPTQAIILENFFPTHAGVMVRKGWFRYYRDIPGPTETIIKYNASSGVEKIFACANHSFIDVSLGGTYAAGDVAKSGFTNNRWQYTQMANLAGDFTVAVNGEDVPQIYNGAAWVDAVITQDPSIVPPVAGFDPKKFIHVTQMHRRLWFTEKNSTRVWYLPADVVQGAVKLFDLGEVFPLGGFAQLCMSWSVDTGAGMDDQSIFLSSKGNIAVFSGFDPALATGTEGAFTMVGVYTVGATIGRRCACPYGSDVLMLTENGVMSLTSVLGQSKLLSQRPITDIIQHKVSDLVTQFSTLFGWDLFTSARYNQLLSQYPRSRRDVPVLHEHHPAMRGPCSKATTRCAGRISTRSRCTVPTPIPSPTKAMSGVRGQAAWTILTPRRTSVSRSRRGRCRRSVISATQCRKTGRWRVPYSLPIRRRRSLSRSILTTR